MRQPSGCHRPQTRPAHRSCLAGRHPAGSGEDPEHRIPGSPSNSRISGRLRFQKKARVPCSWLHARSRGGGHALLPSGEFTPNAAVRNGCHNMDAVPGAKNRVLQGDFTVTLETRSRRLDQGGNRQAAVRLTGRGMEDPPPLSRHATENVDENLSRRTPPTSRPLQSGRAVNDDSQWEAVPVMRTGIFGRVHREPE